MQALAWEVARALTKLGIAIAASNPMMATTIMISTSVKPVFAMVLFRFIFQLAQRWRETRDYSTSNKPWSRARVRRIIRALQTLRGDMRVHLRGDQMRVAEQFLYAAQVGTGIQQMRGVTVPQFVRRERRVQPGSDEIIL